MPVVRNSAQVERSPLRVVRNTAYIQRRKRLARWSALLGLALLGSTFWLAFRGPNYILLSYVPLIAGMMLFHLGMQQIAKWNARNDLRLDKLLAGLGQNYALLHYVTLGKRTIEHLLVYPGGVLVLTARELPGRIVHRNDRWRKQGAGIGRLFGMGGPQLGNPSLETRANVDAVAAFLAEAGLEADVDGAIVFLHPAVELDVEEPDFPVTNADGLPQYVRSLPADPSLRPTDRQALIDLLAPGGQVEVRQPAPRRRPVKRRAA